MTNGTRRGWGVSITPPAALYPGKDPVPIVQEARWATGLVWTGAENLAPTRIQSPDRPARSQSLYQLRYLAHLLGLDPPYNVVCTGATFCVKFLSPATAAVDDIYYLLGGGLSMSVGRYAKETLSSSGSLPSNVSNPQWHGIEVPCVIIGLLGHWL